MDIRIGVDLVQVDRVRALLDGQPVAATELFTARELAACPAGRARYTRLAGRFAAKEAVLKALGTGLGPDMRFTDIEVLNEPWGAPRTQLYGQVHAAFHRRGGHRPVTVSISHTAGFALAQAVFVTGSPEPVATGAGEGDACGSC